jgi:hypothetical protein
MMINSRSYAQNNQYENFQKLFDLEHNGSCEYTA